MAYLNLLASVTESDIASLRADPSVLLQPSMVFGASHLIAYWVEAQPLGSLLGRALDGGEIIRPELWHPLRVPLFHRPAAVRELAEQIDTAMAINDDYWLTFEVGRLLRVFRHAAEAGECVVSVLDSPSDAARADRVRSLWLTSENTVHNALQQTFQPFGFLGWLRSLWK